ncbi:Transcription initiation factor TFIID subunit 2 [Exaiptasia diaphana]|nr:Transcription initiation factor TFIID subunit 2 [Exaiptasia diaphana]
MRICIRDEKKGDWYEAGFQFDDMRGRPVCGDAKKRNLDYFFACQQNSVTVFDPDKSGGELTIRVPKEVQACAMERRQFRISIEYSLDHPEGGIQFVTPKGEGSMAERSAHLFTYGYGNSSRLWFPCVDCYSEVCTWSIDITTSKDMIAVSSGELVEQILNADDKTKTFQYELNIPTSAPNIALAVGVQTKTVQHKYH